MLHDKSSKNVLELKHYFRSNKKIFQTLFTELEESYVINQEAAKELGFHSAEDATGKENIPGNGTISYINKG